MQGEGYCQCGCGQKTPLHKRSTPSRGYVKGQPAKFIKGHRPSQAKPLEERFWPKVDKHGSNGCWLWTASLDGHGYGQIRHGGTTRKAYRVAYELVIGQVPDGMDLDHLCRNSACVNPTHLEPVTRRENARRGIKGVLTTHCPQGHPYDEANTSYSAEGWRSCRVCARDRIRTSRNERSRPQARQETRRGGGSEDLSPCAAARAE